MSGEITSTVPRQDARRDLEGERLAGAGRHDADAVAPGEHGVDDPPLPGTELAVAEHGLEHRLRIGGTGKRELLYGDAVHWRRDSTGVEREGEGGM